MNIQKETKAEIKRVKVMKIALQKGEKVRNIKGKKVLKKGERRTKIKRLKGH